MTITNPRPNPYVGPRSFQTGQKLYGRDRELRELASLLIAERIVLLHSPSGAGKSSLIQAVHRYVQKTGDRSILNESSNGRTVRQRMELALEFLLRERYSKEYDLLWGATTADWGDVQPEHEWGVVLDESSHRAIDIYDNAMFLIAVSNFVALIEDDEGKKARWLGVAERIRKNVRYFCFFS